MGAVIVILLGAVDRDKRIIGLGKGLYSVILTHFVKFWVLGFQQMIYI